jgi:hypothetical protein
METVIGIIFLVLFMLLWEPLTDLLSNPKVILPLVAIGAFYIHLPEQASYLTSFVTTGVKSTGVAYFVGLPALLTWAWPVIAIVGLFVLANALFPSKRA